MTDKNEGFTAAQAAAANDVLRGALGLPQQRFGVEQFVGMISDEIEGLRASGMSDREISSLLSEKVGVQIDSEALAQFYAPPEARGRPA